MTMRIINNFGGRFGWFVGVGIGGFLACAVTSAFLAVCFGMSAAGEGTVVGRYPPPPLDGVPFRGSHCLYYLSAGSFYFALVGLGFAFLGMALAPRRKRR